MGISPIPTLPLAPFPTREVYLGYHRRQDMTVVHLDTKKRISLGKLLNGRDVETFQVESLPNGDIILRPMALVPEHWIHNNPEAFASLRRGIKQAAAGQTRSLAHIRAGIAAKATPKKRK